MTSTAEMQFLLGEICAEVRETREHTGCAKLSQRVLEAFASVPRHAFLPEALRPAAYINRPLPIGHEQTISQPYIVALMTELLETEAEDVVLEVGTGSGYQAALLGRLVKQVYTLEIVAALAWQASGRLRDLGLGNVEVRRGDGHGGWPEHAPFDAIIVTAAAPAVPPALIEQLKPGGRMLIPLGPRHGGQELQLLRKDALGRISRKVVLPVVFVPLTGGAQS